jgi:flavodoxin I
LSNSTQEDVMKSAVVYYSATGKTKTVAEAIHGELGEDTPLVSMDAAGELGDRDVIFVGFPINAFGPPQPAKDFLAGAKAGECIALFVTHASPEEGPSVPEWLRTCKEAAAGADVVGIFNCQGELAEPVKRYMLASNDPHMVAWAKGDNSYGKPDAAALDRARAFARTIVSPVGA